MKFVERGHHFSQNEVNKNNKDNYGRILSENCKNITSNGLEINFQISETDSKKDIPTRDIYDGFIVFHQSYSCTLESIELTTSNFTCF